MINTTGDLFGLTTYQSLLQRWPGDPWLLAVCELAQQKLSGHAHGDLPRWRHALQNLPAGSSGSRISG